MCFSKGDDTPTDTIASAPAAPLGVADVPRIGRTRKAESLAAFGQETPNYRRMDQESSPATM